MLTGTGGVVDGLGVLGLDVRVVVSTFKVDVVGGLGVVVDGNVLVGTVDTCIGLAVVGLDSKFDVLVKVVGPSVVGVLFCG